jgi:NAD-dependent DNA ligase
MNTEQVLKKEILEKIKEKKGKKTRKKEEKIEKEPKKTVKRVRKIKIIEELPKSPSTKLPKPPYNEKFASLMGELSSLMAKRGDNIRSRVYKRAEETIMSITTDINSINEIKNKPGIGKTIIEKFEEYLKTGTLELIEREKNKPENILSDVYGIGPQKAQELVKKGITSIELLRECQDEVLNKVQKIGLKYYEDIMEKIPRSEIDEYNNVFQDIFTMNSDPESKYEIVGSYRRGSQSSGDIDVIITSGDSTVYDKFIDALINNKIIIEVLSRGKSKCLVITRIGKHPARRVDFLYTSKEEYPFAVLYFTGSKSFNTVMRGHALKNGYSLNEHGISKLSDDKKKVNVEGIFTDEKSIFDFLGLKYKLPNERVDGRAVQEITGETVEEIALPAPPKTQKKRGRKPKVKEEKKTKKTSPPKPKVKEEKKTKKTSPPKPKTKEEKKTKKTSPPKPKEKTPSPQKTQKKHEKKQKIKKIEDIKIKEDISKMIKDTYKKKPIVESIHDFKKNGITVLQNISEKELSEIIKYANEQYYNTKNPILTDNEYDIVKEYIEKKYPSNKAIKDIGAPVTKNKVKLPYEMASMDKIKPDTNALENWILKYKGPYVLSCKLDGVSGMYVNKDGKSNLYTRGDGKVGQDITHLISVLKLPNIKDIAIRGEFIIPKRIFEEKYKNTFANPRNLVSGIINSKSIDEKTRDLHFVAYEVIDPPMKPSEQMKKIEELGYEIVMNKTESSLTNQLLSETLLDWRKNYDYEIDGVIVTDDKIYPRVSGNPQHAFAFKMVISEQLAEAKVVDVIWTPSKNGVLKPRVRIEPIKLGGVTIEYATGFNGKFIEENKIGIGAVIEIIRSGDVIPYIKSITTPAEQAKMPDVPYVWSDTHVDIMLENIAEDPIVREKNITVFFTELEVDGLSTGNVKRLIKAGYDSVSKILKMSKSDFESIEGFKTKMADKIYSSIHEKIDKASLLDIMVASNKLGKGLGEKKIRPIIETFPNILTSPENPEQKIEMLKSIKGIGKENATEFVTNIGIFMDFLRECELEGKLEGEIISEEPIVTTNIDKSHPLYGKKIVMTKVRDKSIINALSNYGASLEDSIKKDTFALIVKSKEDKSNKTEFAEKNGIPIMTVEEFKIKYNIV